MSLFTKNCAVLALTAAVALAGAGCEKSRDELRPDMDTVMDHNHGPQSRDLREMAQRMTPSVLASVAVAGSPTKIIVVVKDMANKTENMRGRDLNIYVQKLMGDLNEVGGNSILFVEERATIERIQGQELGNPDPFGQAGRTPEAPSNRYVPQYALYGEVYSMVEGRTTYYLFKFKLTNITTGAISWSKDYDVRTLN